MKLYLKYLLSIIIRALYLYVNTKNGVVSVDNFPGVLFVNFLFTYILLSRLVLRAWCEL